MTHNFVSSTYTDDILLASIKNWWVMNVVYKDPQQRLGSIKSQIYYTVSKTYTSMEFTEEKGAEKCTPAVDTRHRWCFLWAQRLTLLLAPRAASDAASRPVHRPSLSRGFRRCSPKRYTPRISELCRRARRLHRCSPRSPLLISGRCPILKCLT